MSDETKAIENIAILGTPETAWPIAALLSRNTPTHISISVVEFADTQKICDFFTAPVDCELHAKIEISTAQLVKHCEGQLALGTSFQGWRGTESNFFVSPSGSLPLINDVPLHQIMRRAAEMSGDPNELAYLFQPFRFAARAALSGKFAFSSDETGSPTQMLGGQIHISGWEYGAYVKSRYQRDITETHQAESVQTAIKDVNNSIKKVLLDDGTEIAADLFVDTSGHLSDLLPEEEGTQVASFTDILPFDRIALGEKLKSTNISLKHAAVTAGSSSVALDIPLQKKIGSMILYKSDQENDDHVRKLIANASQVVPFEASFKSNPWTGNLIRLGKASASLSAIMTADDTLFRHQANYLVGLIPVNGNMRAEASEFNSSHVRLANQIRDFVCLPFVLNDRDEALWSGIRQSPAPETLQIRLDQFKSRGRLTTFEDEVFDSQTWIETMIGFGVVPERFDPIARQVDMKRVVPTLKKIVADFDRTIQSMPDLDEQMRILINDG